MAEPFILINSYKVKPGKGEEYQERFSRVAELVEAEEPKMLYFAAHVSEDGSETTTVQVHADADNMIFHTQLIAEHVQEAAEYIDWDSMSIELYGTPTEDLLEQMRQVAGSGVSVTVSPPVVSFSRLPVPEQSST